MSFVCHCVFKMWNSVIFSYVIVNKVSCDILVCLIWVTLEWINHNQEATKKVAQKNKNLWVSPSCGESRFTSHSCEIYYYYKDRTKKSLCGSGSDSVVWRMCGHLTTTIAAREAIRSWRVSREKVGNEGGEVISRRLHLGTSEMNQRLAKSLIGCDRWIFN